MITERIPDLERLTATEKLLLASELWDEVTAHPSDIPVSQKLLEELDRRMEEFRRDPATGTIKTASRLTISRAASADTPD